MSYIVNGQYCDEISCGECGIKFFVPSNWVEDRRDKGNYGRRFHCPNGHVRVWSESTLDVVTRERDRLKQANARLEDELRDGVARADREAKKAARVKRRAEAALCPCCNRHFSQLERHMKSKHPDVVKLTPRKSA